MHTLLPYTMLPLLTDTHNASHRVNKVPGDANLCSRLGLVYEKMEDENVACHWQTEAHRYYPVNLNVISWLGVWYVKREMYEQAIEYFDRAAQVRTVGGGWMDQPGAPI